MMNADMLATTRQIMSTQQRTRRFNNIFFFNKYYSGLKMTAWEEERGRQMNVAHHRKNEKQHERNRQKAGDRRTLENLCLAVSEEREEKVAAEKVKALCCFLGGCNNQIRVGEVCSRHGAKQIRTCSKEGCAKQAQSRGVCVAHGAKTKLCSHEGRLSGEGSAKITLGLQKHLMVHAA
jgi:hypothetical protein